MDELPSNFYIMILQHSEDRYKISSFWFSILFVTSVIDYLQVKKSILVVYCLLLLILLGLNSMIVDRLMCKQNCLQLKPCVSLHFDFPGYLFNLQGSLERFRDRFGILLNSVSRSQLLLLVLFKMSGGILFSCMKPQMISLLQPN